MRSWVITTIVLTASVLPLACGMHLVGSQTATPPVITSPVPPQGGIASGSANGPAATGLAPAARPASVVPAPSAFAPVQADGSCPASHPIKVGSDTRAYAPDSPSYAGVRPIACYATLADAQGNGYRPASSVP
jgi:hypothetical protein